MLIIVSPTKQMKWCKDHLPQDLPILSKKSQMILEELYKLDKDKIMALMKVNEKIALENLERYKKIHFDKNGSCALFTYQGLQFQRMNIQNEEQITYLQEHLRILSGLYGVIRPLDSIYPYRLEMQAKLPVNGSKDIYAFWKDTIASSLQKELTHHKLPIILNMASKEYEKAVLPYLPDDSYITLTFKIRKQGKLKVESTQAKIARGAMIHYLSTHHIETLEGVKEFHEEGYQFMKELSNEQEFVFVKESQE